jgi:hypothetical protein
MAYPPDAVETRIYWQLGNGDPFTGGAFGYDSTWTLDGRDVGSSTTRPAGAVTITEAAHAVLEAAYLATWTVRATGGQAFYEAERADEAAVRTTAVAALVAGDALTAAQAASIVGAV